MPLASTASDDQAWIDWLIDLLTRAYLDGGGDPSKVHSLYVPANGDLSGIAALFGEIGIYPTSAGWQSPGISSVSRLLWLYLDLGGDLELLMDNPDETGGLLLH